MQIEIGRGPGLDLSCLISKIAVLCSEIFSLAHILSYFRTSKICLDRKILGRVSSVFQNLSCKEVDRLQELPAQKTPKKHLAFNFSLTIGIKCFVEVLICFFTATH